MQRWIVILYIIATKKI